MISSAVLLFVMSPSIWITPGKGACEIHVNGVDPRSGMYKTDHGLQIDGNDGCALAILFVFAADTILSVQRDVRWLGIKHT